MNTLKPLAAALIATAVMTTAATPAQSADDRQSAGDHIDDATLTSRVKAALARDEDLNARSIKVETKDGIVQLSGFVVSEEAQTQALVTARAVEGVAEVRNDLEVRGAERSAGQVVDDTVIAARVRSSLDDAELGDETDVNVAVNNGVVQLSGFVSSVEQKTRAADTASVVDGVRDVRNNIAVARSRQE